MEKQRELERRVEILAPAGEEEMLRAAVFAGANAVYLGLEKFNARASAGNFTTAALREAVAFCHARDVRVHVAMNTLLLPGEETAVAECLLEIEAAGADAVIVQDLGTAALARRFAPHVALHGSTQMSVHNLSGARVLAALGFQRVILARECSLGEIKRIADGCGIETEVFVHGALCMSMSGQCYMSAFLGGRSGNRGACAGPCRLPFLVCDANQNQGSGGALEAHGGFGARRDEMPPQGGNSTFLVCDANQNQGSGGALEAHGLVFDEAAPLPAESANGSGRRKGAPETAHALSLKDMSYVDALPKLAEAGVASVKIEGRLRTPEYCAVAVSACRCALAGAPFDPQLLQDVFSRSGFTDGYLTGRVDGTMFGARTQTDTEAAKAALPQARALYRREFPGVNVRLSLSVLQEGAVVTACDAAGCSAQARGTTPPQTAQKDPRCAYEAALSKTGGTPFAVEAVSLLEGTEGFVPSGEINALRREALEKLQAQRAQRERERLMQRRAAAPISTEEVQDVFFGAENTRNIFSETPEGEGAPVSEPNEAAEALPSATLRTAAQFASVSQMPEQAAACDALILPLAEGERVPQALRARVWLALPRALFGAAEQSAAALAARARAQGFAGFFVQNLSHFALCAPPEGEAPLPLWGGFGLNITHAGSALRCAALGAARLTLSCETTLLQQRRVTEALTRGARLHGLPRVPETAVLAYGHMPLMLTRACPLQTGRGCAGCAGAGALLDRKGMRCAVRCTAPGAAGVREVYNPVPLWLGDRQNELPCAWALLQFTVETPERCAEVLRLWRRGERFDGAFTRGLSEKGVRGQ